MCNTISSNSWSLHTPNGSPRIQPDSQQEEKNLYDNQSVYGSTPQSMSRMDSSDRYRTPKESIEYIDDVDLDDQLMRLTKEKEKVWNAIKGRSLLYVFNQS